MLGLRLRRADFVPARRPTWARRRARIGSALDPQARKRLISTGVIWNWTGMSRQNSIVVKMREMIVSGALSPGQRVTEVSLAEQLGVSRTPVRYALGVLAGEGLLGAADKRGYFVREFTFEDIVKAIELRGVLEGMAARLLAEAGPSAPLDAQLAACIDEGARIVGAARLDEIAWADCNDRFHGLIVGHSGNKALIDAVAQVEKLPFTSAYSYFGGSLDEAVRQQQTEILQIAQFQHEAVLHNSRDRARRWPAER